MAGLDMNPRTCIVTKQEHTPDEMIRFVLGPQDLVYPDLKRKLPGRGAWVSLGHGLVDQAMTKGAFARAFKTKIAADENLAQQVDDLMSADILNSIALAKKAGRLVPGQAKAEALVRGGDAGLLLTATDAGDDGVSKMGFAVRSLKLHEELDVPVFKLFSSDALDKVTGGTNVMHVAVQYGPMAANIVGLLNRLMQYRGESSEKPNKIN